jgi:hypothetical protein
MSRKKAKTLKTYLPVHKMSFTYFKLSLWKEARENPLPAGVIYLIYGLKKVFLPL